MGEGCKNVTLALFWSLIYAEKWRIVEANEWVQHPETSCIRLKMGLSFLEKETYKSSDIAQLSFGKRRLGTTKRFLRPQIE